MISAIDLSIVSVGQTHIASTTGLQKWVVWVFMMSSKFSLYLLYLWVLYWEGKSYPGLADRLYTVAKRVMSTLWAYDEVGGAISLTDREAIRQIQNRGMIHKGAGAI